MGEATRSDRIVSVSRRTDIPAFFGNEFLRSLQEGVIGVANPFRPSQVRRVSLAPGDVAGFVFWTRNPRPFLPILDEIDARHIPYYFLVTHTGYPPFLEPRGVELRDFTADLETLCRRIGPERIIWRYDPIVFLDSLGPEFHRDQFRALAKALHLCTRRVIVSFLDLYGRAWRRLEKSGLKVFPARERPVWAAEVLADFAATAAAFDLELQLCCEPLGEEIGSVKAGKCIDEELLNRLFGLNIAYRKDPHQRPHCRCQQSVDIGRYRTCPAGCLYCYAY